MKKLIILISAVAISVTMILTACTEHSDTEYIAEETTVSEAIVTTAPVYEEETLPVETEVPVVVTPEETEAPIETTSAPIITTAETTTPAPLFTTEAVATTIETTPAPVNNTPAYSPDGIPLPKGYGQTGYDVYEKKGDESFGNNWQAWGSQIEVPDYNSLTGKHDQMRQQGQANMQAVHERHQAEMERMRQQFYERRGY